MQFHKKRLTDVRRVRVRARRLVPQVLPVRLDDENAHGALHHPNDRTLMYDGAIVYHERLVGEHIGKLPLFVDDATDAMGLHGIALVRRHWQCFVKGVHDASFR
jgi:hypothetical protein